jgi:hypothetical protein
MRSFAALRMTLYLNGKHVFDSVFHISACVIDALIVKFRCQLVDDEIQDETRTEVAQFLSRSVKK